MEKSDTIIVFINNYIKKNFVKIKLCEHYFIYRKSI